MNKEKVLDFMKNSKLLGIIGAALVILGVFLPLVKVDVWFIEKSLSYIEGDGKIVLALSAITLFMIFSDVIGEKVEALKVVCSKITNPKFTLIPTVISVVMMINLMSNYSDYSDYASYQIGFYMIWLGLILSAVYGIFYKGSQE